MNKLLAPILLLLLLLLGTSCLTARDPRDGIRYQCPKCGQVEYHPHPGYWYCSSCKTLMTYCP